MANKDRPRLVVSFQAENDVLSRVDEIAEKRGLSRSVALGLLFEPVLQAYVETDSTLKVSVCSDENIRGKLTSPVSFRTDAALISRVDAVAEKENLSRSAVLGLLFSAASKDPTFHDSTQKNVVVRDKNKGTEFNPPVRGAAKKVPAPFKAAVKQVSAAVGLDEGEKEPVDKKDSVLSRILTGVGWVGGALIVVALAMSGKAPGGTPGGFTSPTKGLGGGNISKMLGGK